MDFKLTLENKGEVKVALLDDGVRSNYAGLDDNIATGMTCATVKASDQRFKQNHNYNISEFGHGTAMAYFIRRICPRVRLYIARLDGRDNARGVSFTVDSAVQVSVRLSRISTNEKVNKQITNCMV